MRSCEEMTAEVFRRIKAEAAARKRKRRAMVRAISIVCCFCLVTLVGVGVWQTVLRGAPSENPPPGASNASAASGQPSGDPVDEPRKSIDAFYPAQISAGEFVIDMYRPEGYSQWVGSALALKLELSENEAERFPVLIGNGNRSLEEVIAEVNLTLAEPIEFAALWTVNVVEVVDSALVDPEEVIPLYDSPQYYGTLTAAQILALTTDRYRIRCSYVGSGEGDRRDAGWDTPEGMAVYCELLGDQMIFADGHIECYPDIYAVDRSHD